MTRTNHDRRLAWWLAYGLDVFLFCIWGSFGIWPEEGALGLLGYAVGWMLAKSALILTVLIVVLQVAIKATGKICCRRNKPPIGWLFLTLGALLVLNWTRVVSPRLIWLGPQDAECAESFSEIYTLDRTVIRSTRITAVGGYNIVIYGDGSAYYHESYWHPATADTRYGKLSREKMHELIGLFREGNFFCFASEYKDLPPINSITSGTSDTVTLMTGGLEKSVGEYHHQDNAWRGSPLAFRKIVEELQYAVKALPQANPEGADQFCMTTIWAKMDENQRGATKKPLCDP